MDTKEIAVKGIVGVITGVLMYASGWVSNIWWILIILMGIDYITGVVGAAVNRCLSSEVGWKGIVRKAGILILTVVCMLVDYAVANISSGIGFTFPLQGMVTILVCCWLIGNELLSIMENLGKMGVPVPSFLGKLFRSFQKQVEDIAPEVDKPGGTDA